ncbi:DUF7553 family protein [Halobellus sp. GM3]|uniref:DUF7553 family protein n=1 Tax=Halobellus sp. GM3 TaxID=3458410 RepID=UPI00403E2D63
MAHELLEAASDHLRAAAESASGDVQERIYDQSDALAELAASDRTPDHGRLARHMNVLAELADETAGTAHDDVVAAREEVSEFREGVEGV